MMLALVHGTTCGNIKDDNNIEEAEEGSKTIYAPMYLKSRSAILKAAESPRKIIRGVSLRQVPTGTDPIHNRPHLP